MNNTQYNQINKRYEELEREIDYSNPIEFREFCIKHFKMTLEDIARLSDLDRLILIFKSAENISKAIDKSIDKTQVWINEREMN